MNIREWYQDAKARTDPDILAASGALALGGAASVAPIEGLAAMGINAIQEFTKGEPSFTRLGLVAASIALNSYSIYNGKKALEEERIAASTGSVILNTATGKPLLSSAIDHFANIGALTAVNFGTDIATASGNESDLTGAIFRGGLIASFEVAAWNIGVNKLIRAKKIEPVVERIKKTRESVTERFGRRRGEVVAAELTSSIDYHRAQRDMRIAIGYLK